jgi:hypothetical protein
MFPENLPLPLNRQVDRRPICALCLEPMSVRDWEERHDGCDPVDEVHAQCCRIMGPCSYDPGEDPFPAGTVT